MRHVSPASQAVADKDAWANKFPQWFENFDIEDCHDDLILYSSKSNFACTTLLTKHCHFGFY